MALWGVLCGSTVAIAEAGYSLLGGVVFVPDESNSDRSAFDKLYS